MNFSHSISLQLPSVLKSPRPDYRRRTNLGDYRLNRELVFELQPNSDQAADSNHILKLARVFNLDRIPILDRRHLGTIGLLLILYIYQIYIVFLRNDKELTRNTLYISYFNISKRN